MELFYVIIACRPIRKKLNIQDKYMDLTIIYYTSNHLDSTNPYFLDNTKKQLVKATGDLPIIAVSQKPTTVGDNCTNICLGDIGRSHLNIYRQMLVGAKEARTKYIALAEDDILYSYEHFHTEVPRADDIFLYDMNKVSLFTWTIPVFSFRHDRMVVNQLIAPRVLFIQALEERFKRVDELLAEGKEEKDIIKYWGDLGRYERLLGVTPRRTDTFMCKSPSIVFSHEDAFGFLSQGKKKKLGDLRIVELYEWGRAEDIKKLFYKEGESFNG